MKEFKTNLMMIRKERGLSRAELAEKSGVKLSAIRDYEQGHKPINNAAAFTVYALALALDVTVEDLLELKTEMLF